MQRASAKPVARANNSGQGKALAEGAVSSQYRSQLRYQHTARCISSITKHKSHAGLSKEITATLEFKTWHKISRKFRITIISLGSKLTLRRSCKMIIVLDNRLLQVSLG